MREDRPDRSDGRPPPPGPGAAPPPRSCRAGSRRRRPGSPVPARRSRSRSASPWPTSSIARPGSCVRQRRSADQHQRPTPTRPGGIRTPGTPSQIASASAANPGPTLTDGKASQEPGGRCASRGERAGSAGRGFRCRRTRAYGFGDNRQHGYRGQGRHDHPDQGEAKGQGGQRHEGQVEGGRQRSQPDRSRPPISGSVASCAATVAARATVTG